MPEPEPRITTPTPTHWEATVPNQLPPLMRAIADLGRWLELAGADPEARYLAQLATEELGTNIIKYGYDDEAQHVILLSAFREDDFFRIRLEDDGHEFNPCLAREPDPSLGLADRVPGGWGLSLVRRLSAGMAYERRDGRNIVSVRLARATATAP